MNYRPPVAPAVIVTSMIVIAVVATSASRVAAAADRSSVSSSANPLASDEGWQSPRWRGVLRVVAQG